MYDILILLRRIFSFFGRFLDIFCCFLPHFCAFATSFASFFPLFAPFFFSTISCLTPLPFQHLVASVGDDAYVALAKGGIVPGHVIIIPLSHAPTPMDVSPSTGAEMTKYKDAIRALYRSQGKSAFFFDVTIRSQHVHVQAVPVPDDRADLVEAELLRQFQQNGLELVPMEHADMSQPYWRGEAPNGNVWVHVTNGGHSNRFPLQIGRTIAANVLGTPERAGTNENMETYMIIWGNMGLNGWW